MAGLIANRTTDNERVTPPSHCELYPEVLSSETIRLLNILPSENSENTVRCELYRHDLKDLPPFEALSYNWGAPEPGTEVIVNRVPISVTLNLGGALKRHRLRDRKRLIWADALCINQQCVEEKNHQIPFMRTIYSIATQVIAWLRDEVGDDPGCVASVLQSISDYASRSISATDWEFPGENTLVAQHSGENRIDDTETEGYREVRSLASLDQLLDDPSVRESFRRFVANPYFRRVWCVQEIVLARDVLIYYRDQEIPWDDVQRALRRADDKAGFLMSTSYWPYSVGVCQLGLVRRSFQEDRAPSNDPAFLLYMFNTFEASDPRDKVYGILGMLHPAVASFITVEYAKTVNEVYADAIVASVQATAKLWCMRMVSHENEDYNGGDGFKSWVPRWDIQTENESELSWLTMHTQHLSSWSWKSEGVLDIEVLGKDLLVRGMRFDEVSSTRPPTCYKFDPGRLGEFGLAVMTLSDSLISEHGADNFDLAKFANTLVMGSELIKGNVVLAAEIPAEKENVDLNAMAFFALVRDSWMDHQQNKFNPAGGLGCVYLQLSMTMCARRRFFQTSAGLYGLGPHCLRENDIISILSAAGPPCVLRPHADGGFLFLGHCYIHELTVDHFDNGIWAGKFERREFLLV